MLVVIIFSYAQAEKSLGSIDLKECTAVNQATVKKGYGLTIQVYKHTSHCSIHIHIMLYNYALSTAVHIMYMPVSDII